jgi:hypothetical protein
MLEEQCGRASSEGRAVTEEEWLACADPTPILAFLRVKASDRKLRLFAVACCRRIWHLFRDDNDRQAVEVSERLADGLATNAERRAAALAAGGGYGDAGGAAVCAVGVPPIHAAERASDCAASAFATAGERTLLPNHQDNPAWQRLFDAERASQCDLTRDIFGNPFRPLVFDPRWRSADTVGVGRGIYEDRGFDRLPLLADALMDAGCSDEQVIGHCRSEGPHVRGCWVVDLVLGKE